MAVLELSCLAKGENTQVSGLLDRELQVYGNIQGNWQGDSQDIHLDNLGTLRALSHSFFH